MEDHTVEESLIPEQPQTTIAPTPIPLGFDESVKTWQYSDARPFWYVSVMIIATFGIYQIVWFYRSWRTLMLHYQLKGNNVINALFSPFCAWSFFRYALDLGKQGGYLTVWPSNLIATVYFFTCFVANAAWRAPNEYPRDDMKMIICFVCTVFILVPLNEGVRAMNAGYAMLYPEKQIRTRLSAGAIISIIIGSLCWVIIFFSPYFTPGVRMERHPTAIVTPNN